MELLIQPDGGVRCLYGEEIELQHLGRLTIARGSHVEPTANGQWTADLAPVNGPLLGPFPVAPRHSRPKWLGCKNTGSERLSKLNP